MKIYTYYQNLDGSSISKKHEQEIQLIELWKNSWSKQGFTPIVLNLNDAKKNSLFNFLDENIRNLHFEITGDHIQEYGMSCWYRWLAYGVQADEKFYVSDYDAINVNFKPIEPIDELHFMDADCPFFASGTPTQFNLLAYSFINFTNIRKTFLSKQEMDWYHDQEFFTFNLVNESNPNSKIFNDKLNCKFTRVRPGIGDYYDPKMDLSDYKVLHVASSNIDQIKASNSDFEKEDSGELRIKIIQSILNKLS